MSSRWWSVLSLILIFAIGCAGSSSSSTPPDTEAPSAPTNLAATTQDETYITVQWNASIDNVTASSQLVYEVCWSDANGGCDAFSVVDTTAPGTTTYTATGLNQSTFYFFRVRAKDASGNVSAATAQIDHDTDGP